MPIIKKHEPLGKRPVIILIYGESGIGKTSLFNTAEEPLLIDFDRGVDRSILRQDILKVNSWNDVLKEEKEGSFKSYKTIGIDTAKAALDDFLMSHVIDQNWKLKTNKLQAYGAIGDDFKLFVNNRRQEDADIVIIAHAKDDKEGDVIRKIPDVTGQSYQLLLRIADQVGYMRTINNKRTIQFEPSDTTVGKNVARLETIEIPNDSDPAFRNFMATLIDKVKNAINNMSEAQREAVAQSEAFQKDIDACETPDCLTEILTKVNGLPEYLKAPLKKLIGAKAKERGYIANTETKRFEDPNAGKEKETDQAETAETSFEDRCKKFADAGMTMESDQAVKGDLVFTYDQIAEMPEADFLASVDKAAKTKKPTRKTATAA